MMKKCLFLLFLSASIFAAPQDQNAKDPGPWFTGPLLAPSASCNSFRELTWQPYLFFTNTFGSFDNNWNRKNAPNLYTVRALVDITYGISAFMDIEATPSFVYQTSQGSSSVRMSDTPIFLGIQVLRQTKDNYLPDLCIRLMQTLPLGQYDKLNPKNNGTDQSGDGTFESGITFDFQRLFQVSEDRYFRLRWAIVTTLYASDVHVKGLNAYGGGPKTSGTVSPGKPFTFFLSGEYTLTQNWGLAFDTVYILKTPSSFSGKTGGDKVGTPTSHQITFAPAVEYNFSKSIGIIGGGNFALAGKNASNFWSGIISAVISY